MSNGASNGPRKALGVFLPAVGFFLIVVVFAVMLTQEGRDTSALPSALIGLSAPQTSLPPVPGIVDADGEQVAGFEPAKLSGNISLVNVWASWCAPCREEHPLLMALAQDARLQIIGMNHKDKAENAAQFLSSLGNPYDLIGADINGRASIEWGVYGVPETFLVGPDGTVVFKHTGPLSEEIITQELMPEIDKLVDG